MKRRMANKVVIWVLMLVVLISVMLPVYGASSKYEKLNVGVMVSTMSIPVFYAQDKGWFKEAGLNVNVIIFPTGVPINEAIAAKQLDIACSGFAAIYSVASGSCKWIAETNTTNGAGIYARPDSPIVKEKGKVKGFPKILGSKETLRGVKILGPLGTSAQFINDGYIAKFGLKETDVSQVHMEFGPAYQAFVSGQGDLLSVSPPYSYDCVAKGYVEVCSFEDATNVVVKDGCFARTEVIQKRRGEVKLFLKVLLRALNDLADNPQMRFTYSMKKYHENAQEFTDRDLKNEIADRQYIGTKFLKKKDYVFGEAMDPSAEFLVAHGKIRKEDLPNVVKGIDSSLISEVSGLKIKQYGK